MPARLKSRFVFLKLPSTDPCDSFKTTGTKKSVGDIIQPLNFDLNQGNLERNSNVITLSKLATLENKTAIRNLFTEH